MLGAIENQGFLGNATIVTMKLHLPHALRTVLLTILAVPAATTLTTGSLLGLAATAMIAGQQAEAKNIIFEGGALENFTYGSRIGDTTFAQGDAIIFTGDTVLTLGADITSSGVRVQEGTLLTVTGKGHTLTAPIILSSNGVLTLNDQALANNATVSGNDGVLRIDWGATEANLSNQLTGFKGTLLINNSTYRLENGESYGQLFLHGSSTLNAGALTYSGGLFSSGNSAINSTGDTTFSGGVYGFGALTKTGAGTLSLTQTNSYHTGDLDTQYLTAFARYTAKSWVHTFVASLGRADISLERTVSHAYGSYTAKGDTTGIGFGLMYEVGKVFAMNEDASACIQPVLNVTLAHASISGYTETGSDAALEAGDIDATTFAVGAGICMQAIGGGTIYNRTSIWEARALVKVNAGDRKVENDVAFAGTPDYTATVESAETGAVGVELGAGLTIPIGAESDAFFADVSAELRTGYTSVNGTVGYRFNF